MNNKGLTLIELLGAVAIIAVICSIAFTSVHGFVAGGKEAATIAQVRTLNLALAQARIRADDPVLYTTNKYAVYDYLKAKGFLVGGE